MNAAIFARIGVGVVALALAWVLLRLDGVREPAQLARQRALPRRLGVPRRHVARRLTSANLMSVVAAVMAITLGGVVALTG